MADSFRIVPTKDSANTRVQGQKFADYDPARVVRKPPARTQNRPRNP